MYEYERINEQLNDYQSFLSSILNFLQKYLTQFHRALSTYSTVLKHLHTKSISLLLKNKSHHRLSNHLHQAFRSFTQTFDDEYYQLNQRARFLKMSQLTIEKLQAQITSTIISKRKQKLHNYTYQIARLNRNKKRQYLYKLIQQIRKHEKLTLTWQNDLDHVTSHTTNLLWRLFSYSPYKFDVKPIQTPNSSTLSIIDTVDQLLGIENDRISPPIQLGAGDQLQTKSMKGQEAISSSNNALIISTESRQNNDENSLLNSTDIDQTIVKKNQFDHDNLLQHKRLTQSNNSLHLSDISYTTDYYSQNDSD